MTFFSIYAIIDTKESGHLPEHIISRYFKKGAAMPVIYYTYYSPVSQNIRDVSAQEHHLGRRLLVQGLRDLYQLTFSCGQMDALLTADKNGKPYLPGYPNIFFNISHCSGLVACAFDSHSVGIDVELPGYFPDILIRRSLSETEKGFLLEAGNTPALRQEWFYRLWTLKEAYVKESGCGVDTNLTEFSFSFDLNELPFQIRCSDSRISCFQEKLSGGHILSLCYLDTGTPVFLTDRSKR